MESHSLPLKPHWLPDLARSCPNAVRYQRSLYVKRACFNAATIAANAPVHQHFRINSQILLPWWDRPRLAGLGQWKNETTRHF
eukprot:5210442-Amphidinium_carterae.1